MAFTREDEAGTIYEGKSAAGTEFLKITVNGEKFVAFRNKYKEQERHPDWKVYKDKPREQAPSAFPRPVTAEDVPF